LPIKLLVSLGASEAIDFDKWCIFKKNYFLLLLKLFKGIVLLIKNLHINIVTSGCLS